ncbi:MAG: PadR family transcriptional regulator [Rhodospirillaceae bacterium]|nr:PadR family transcriptional regulator [Rhodospirillaceae bacterium]
MFRRFLDKHDSHGGWRFAHDDREDGGEHDHDHGHGRGRGRHGRGGAHFMRGGMHGGGRGGRGGRFGKGMARFFAHGDLRLVVLNLIAEKPRHGYEIIKAIEERVGGAYSPSPGVIYPTLTLLEELAYVTVQAEEGGSKKLYVITPEGQAFMEANRKTLDALHARMDDAGRTHSRGDAPQVVRAMENLKMALRLKFSRGPLSDDQVNAVAAALDGAATAIDKI